MGTVLHKIRYLNKTKDDIRDALIGKGSEVTTQDTFRSYADFVSEISGGGTNAGLFATFLVLGSAAGVAALTPYEPD